MADNTLGSVSIIIRGDWSKLPGDLAAAGAAASQFGASIAGGFNQSAAGADKVVIAIGRLAGIIQQESAAASVALQRNLVAALGSSEQAVTKLTSTMPGLASGAQAAGFNLRYAFFAVKDIAEGRGAFAIAEIANTLVRLGPAALAAGASLGVLAAAFYGPIAAAKDLAKEIDKTNQEVDDGLEKSLRAIEAVNVRSQELRFGAAAGKKLEGFYGEQAYQSDLDKVKVLTSQLQEMTRQAAQFHPTDPIPYLGSKNRGTEQKAIVDKQAEIDKLSEQIDEERRKNQFTGQDASQLSAQQSGAQGAARVSAQIAALGQRTDAARAAATLEITLAHQAREAQIKGIDDVGEREMAAADEASRFAQDKQRVLTETMSSQVEERIALIRKEGAAKAAGKPGPEQANIGIETEKSVTAYRAEAAKEGFAAYAAAAEAENAIDEARASAAKHWLDEDKKLVGEAFDYRERRARQAFETENAPAAYNSAAGAKAAGTLAKGEGQRKELEIEGQKIALEGQYDQMIFKTAADKVQFAEAEAVLDAAARDAKLKGLEADLADAEAIAASVKGTEAYIGALERVATLKNQVADLSQSNANAAAKQSNQVQQDKNQANVGYQIGQDISKALSQTLPQALGGALASGIFDAPKGGQNKGQELAGAVTTALKNTGKQLFGEAMSQALKSVISAILTQTGLQAALNALFPVVQTAQTVAVVTAITGSTAAIVTAVLAAGVVAAFAEGGRPAVGMASIVGEKGPELFIPDSAGTVVPSGKFASAGINLPFAQGNTNSGTAASYQFSGPMHFHGVQNVRDMMRGVADYAKSQSPQFSAYSK